MLLERRFDVLGDKSRFVATGIVVAVALAGLAAVVGASSLVAALQRGLVAAVGDHVVSPSARETLPFFCRRTVGVVVAAPATFVGLVAVLAASVGLVAALSLWL